MAWTIYKVHGCCGMAELYGINSNDGLDIKTLLAKLRTRARTNNRLDFGIGVMVHRMGHGVVGAKSDRLAKFQRYISKHKLGSLRISKGTPNPNTLNWLVTGTWDMDTDAVIRHAESLYRADREANRVRFTAPNLR